MNGALERLGGLAARRWWVFIIAWVVILGGPLGAGPERGSHRR
jgi:hypothetical protein